MQRFATGSSPFLVCLATLVPLLIATACTGPEQREGLPDPAQRPNILLAISDDQSYPHTGAYGDPVVSTPTFDRIAREGVLFERAFVAAPSCTPSRGAILTGQDVWRLREGGNLWSHLPPDFVVYPDLLEQAGYFVGFERKGWGPGRVDSTVGRTRNPAGPRFDDFAAFLEARPEGQPFVYWFGSQDPHRAYEQGTGEAKGLNAEAVRMPGFLPDLPEIRSDLLDYYFEVERFDTELGQILEQLEAVGELDNTLVVVTSDNGMPFPRAKATLYDSGTHVPLAVRWPAGFEGGRRVEDFVNLKDLAPTFLEAAGVDVPEAMTGRSLLSLLRSGEEGQVEPGRDFVVTARERHAWVRRDGLGYPARAIRTNDYLYIVNFESDRWPAGDPDPRFSFSGHGVEMGGEPQGYGDIDPSPSKEIMMEIRDDYPHLFALAFDRRPAEELYVLADDPDQLDNKANDPAHASVKQSLRERLMAYLEEHGDPRALGRPAPFDTYPYYGRKSPDADARGQ